MEELGIDANDGWRDAIATGREPGGVPGLAPVSLDAPDEAIRVLTELEYEVVWRGKGPEPSGRADRLREL